MSIATAYSAVSNWLRFKYAGKPPPRPERADDRLYADFTFSTKGGVSAAMSPSDLQGILSEAAEGYSCTQAALIKEIQEKEPLIAAHLATRKAALMGCPWKVQGEDEQDKAEELTAMLTTAGLSDALSHLCDYVPTGYSLVVNDWTEGGKAIAGFLPVAPEVIEFDLGGNMALQDKMGVKHLLAKEHPAQFLTVLGRSKPGLPCRNGLGRSLVWMYLFKHSGLAGAARYVEKFGSPFMYATIPAGQWGERGTILATLKAMGRDHAGVIKEGGTIENLTGANADSTDAQMQFLKYCDDIFAVAILGQLATSGDAGGLSKGQAQENVRMDLLAGDARALMAAVNKGLILPLCQMRYGWPDTKGLSFEIEYEPSEDLDAKATRYKTLTEVTGRMMDVATVEEEFGVKFGEPKPEPVMVAPGGAVQGGTGAAGNGAAVASGGKGKRAVENFENPQAPKTALSDLATFADTPAAVGALDLIAREALRRYTADEEAAAAWLGPVQQAVREAFGDLAPDDVEGFTARVPLFQASLPAVLSKMDASGFERQLGDAMLAAVVNGFEEGQPRPFPVTLYDLGQMRVAAGSPRGGQWTAEGAAAGLTGHTGGLKHAGKLRNRLAGGGDFDRVQTGTKTIPAREASEKQVKIKGGGGATKTVQVKAAPERTVPVQEYRHKDGTPATEAEASFLKKLGVPPAAHDVQVTMAPDAKNWAAWKDKSGQQQIRRSAAQEDYGKAKKLDRTRKMAGEMGALRTRVAQHQLEGRPESMVFEIEDRTVIRLGSTAEGRGKVKAYGLTTLEGRHAMVSGDTVSLKFIGKHAKENTATFTDARLARFVADRKAAAGDGGKLWSDVGPSRFHKYVKEVSRGRYSTKDFRTVHATRTALEVVRPHIGKTLSIKDKRAIVRSASEAASKLLNNTPGMALKSYIDPAVFDLIGEG